MIKIGKIQISDIGQFDWISLVEYKKIFKNNYRKIAPDKRDELMKLHYDKLKTHFTKKKVYKEIVKDETIDKGGE